MSGRVQSCSFVQASRLVPCLGNMAPTLVLTPRLANSFEAAKAAEKESGAFVVPTAVSLKAHEASGQMGGETTLLLAIATGGTNRRLLKEWVWRNNQLVSYGGDLRKVLFKELVFEHDIQARLAVPYKRDILRPCDASSTAVSVSASERPRGSFWDSERMVEAKARRAFCWAWGCWGRLIRSFSSSFSGGGERQGRVNLA